MKIQGLEYERGFNLGNYEQEKIKVMVLVEEGENPSEILTDTIGFVNSRGTKQIQSKITNGVATVSGQNMVASSGTGSGNVGTSSTTSAADEKKAKKEAKALAEAKAKEEAEAKATSETKTEAKVEAKGETKSEVKTEAAAEVKTEAAPPAKKSKLSSVYNRTTEVHKKIVGEILTKNFPGWDHKDKIHKAKEVSETMNGKEFMDGEGLVLQSFTDELIKLMKEKQ